MDQRRDIIEPTAAQLKGQIVVDVTPLLPDSTSLSVLLRAEDLQSSALVGAVRAAGTISPNPKAQLCTNCKDPVHRGTTCTVCGENPCIKCCPDCLHEPHREDGLVCVLCKELVSGTSKLCIPRCPVSGCRHLGKRAKHAIDGCAECLHNAGCNAIASLHAENMAAEEEEAAEAGVGLDNSMEPTDGDIEIELAAADISDEDEEPDEDYECMAHTLALLSVIHSVEFSHDTGDADAIEDAIDIVYDSAVGGDLECAVEAGLQDA